MARQWIAADGHFYNLDHVVSFGPTDDGEFGIRLITGETVYVRSSELDKVRAVIASACESPGECEGSLFVK